MIVHLWTDLKTQPFWPSSQWLMWKFTQVFCTLTVISCTFESAVVTFFHFVVADFCFSLVFAAFHKIGFQNWPFYLNQHWNLFRLSVKESINQFFGVNKRREGQKVLALSFTKSLKDLFYYTHFFVFMQETFSLAGLCQIKLIALLGFIFHEKVLPYLNLQVKSSLVIVTWRFLILSSSC